MKYVILAVFVVILPVVFKAASGLPVPAFCKYICPAGTHWRRYSPGASGRFLSGLAGALFHWKVLVLAVILVSACFLYRSFCRILCPLGPSIPCLPLWLCWGED